MLALLNTMCFFELCELRGAGQRPLPRQVPFHAQAFCVILKTAKHRFDARVFLSGAHGAGLLHRVFDPQGSVLGNPLDRGAAEVSGDDASSSADAAEA